MEKIDLNNKTFVLVNNSEKGDVNANTQFRYFQQDDLVTANYSGGPIRSGQIIAKLEGQHLHMLYHCLTVENELKAGKAIANISRNKQRKLKLTLQWEWLNGFGEKGTSEYVEL